jgi:chemotaxis protein MotB
MARKPEPEHGPNHERWLLSYADFITLLLVFFIIMYSMSSMDKAKFDQLVQMLSESFGGARSVIAMNHNGVLEKNFMPSHVRTKEQKSLYVKAVSQLQKEIESKEVRVTADNRGIIISLSSDCFFASGSADLNDSLLSVITKVAGILKPLPNEIRVEGHTDDLPIVPGSSLSQRYQSNWELAAQRAVNVLRKLEENDVNRDRMSAVSYADTRPIKPDNEPGGRAFNRRVAILVMHTPVYKRLSDFLKSDEEL